jgi:transcription antitermination factor NusG
MKPRSGLALALSVGDEIPIDILTVIGAKQAEEAPISFGENAKWFVVCTEVKAEFRASEAARAKGFTVFMPIEKRWKKHARRKKESLLPLMPRYFFVAFDPNKEGWTVLLSINGVEGVLSSATGVPIAVPAEIVEDLQLIESMGQFDETKAVSRMQPGDKLKVVKGPFVDFIVDFIAEYPDKRVEVLLRLFGAERAIKVPVADVRPA